MRASSAMYRHSEISQVSLERSLCSVANELLRSRGGMGSSAFVRRLTPPISSSNYGFALLAENANSLSHNARRAQEGFLIGGSPIFSGLARPPRAEAEKKAEARRDTLPNANATHPSAMAKDLYAATGNHEKRGSRAAVFCLFK